MKTAKHILQVTLSIVLIVIILFAAKDLTSIELVKNNTTQEDLKKKIELKNPEHSEKTPEKNSKDVKPTPEKKKKKVLASPSPYNDGTEVLNDKGKLEMWELLERQRETRHDYTQIIEAQLIFSDLLTKCDTNVFMMQIVMNGLDSLKVSYEQNNTELMGIDSKLIYYRYYLREDVILKK